MSSEPLSVGMLGYRFMGKAHSNALARLPMFFPDAPAVEREVLIGRDEEALADAADQLGFARTATDWEAVVDEVDVFYNLGPNSVHQEPSVAALEAETPVFCEKPLAPALADAETMAAAADSAGVPNGCAFNYRYVPAIQYARELVASGALGEIHHFRGRYMQDWLVDPEAPWSWRNSAELAGSGALGDLGAHTVDLTRFLVGNAPGAGSIDRVSGQLQTFVDERPVEGEDETRPVTVDDAYSAQLAFDGGAVGTIEASRFANGKKNDHTVEIHGSDGSLRFSLERLNELEVMTGDDRGYQTVLVTDPEDPYVDHWWPPGHIIGWEHTFLHENYEFLKLVSSGTTPESTETDIVNFQEALEVQRVLDAIERSDERGEWITVG